MASRADKYEIVTLLQVNATPESVTASGKGLISNRALILFVKLTEWSQENLNHPSHVKFRAAVGEAAYLRRIERARRLILTLRSQKV